MKRVPVLSAVVTACLLGCGGDATETSAQVEAVTERAHHDPGFRIAPIHSRPYGRSYGEWEAAWWQWTMRVPAVQDPIGDATGEHCAVGQSGPVWFLAGTWGGAARRECTVPRSKALYFPLVNWVWVLMLTDPPATLDELRTTLRDNLAGATMAASIDGHSVVSPSRYYEETPVFPATFGFDNSWGVTAAECPRRGRLYVCPEAIDAGYALFVNPLSAGDHTVHFEATLTNGFSLDVTYTLHVR